MLFSLVHEKERSGKWNEAITLLQDLIHAHPPLASAATHEIARLRRKYESQPISLQNKFISDAPLLRVLPEPAADKPVQVVLETPFAEAYAIESLANYTGPKSASQFTTKDLPLVSIVMTSHNAEVTVEGAIQSLLNQSYPNIEIVICDDASTDSTWSLLTELRRRSKNILRIFRLQTNSGTYLAKNIAISEARGEIVLFQDSDDYSHPDRVLVQVLPLLENENLIGTRSKYLRFDPISGRIIPVAGLLSKFGLITLAVRRRAFEHIGYFDAVRKAGDDEWFQRLQHVYGRNMIKSIDVSLYLAELRSNSLIADALTFNGDGSIEQAVSPTRRLYVDAFSKRFADKQKGRAWYRESFYAYPLRPVDRIDPTVDALPEIQERVYASLCSIPSREASLIEVVKILLPQTDGIFVYLDKYSAVPKFLRDNKKITVFRSQDFAEDFRDNGKFLAFDMLKNEGKPFFYFTCDDDIVYPPDYVHTLISRLRKFELAVVAGVHGVVCEEYPTRYFQHRYVHHFISANLHTCKLVNNLGTGTVAFHSHLFETLDPRMWPYGGMVDILFSKECKRKLIPMISIDRHAGWMREINSAAGTPTLYNEFNDKEQLIIEQLAQSAPWGYHAILESVSSKPTSVRSKLEELLPMFAAQVEVRTIYPRLRG